MRGFLANFITNDTLYSTSDTGLSNIFSSNNSITATTAQRIANVFGCINIKANALAILPIKVYVDEKEGKKEDKTSILYELLRHQPNAELTAFEWKKMISQDLDLRGNHYCQIIRNGLNKIVELQPLFSDKMQVKFSSKKEKAYYYNRIKIASYKILHFIDIPDEQGLKGISRIEKAKQTLEFANNTATHGNKVFKNSVSPTGAFEIPGELTEAAFNRLNTDLQEKYSGLNNSGQPLLLEGGLKFVPMSLKNSDAQWIESKKLNREEIATIFGVPSSMLNDTANTAYTNLEQKYQEFHIGTILPLTTLIESKCRQSLLNPKEKNTISIKFVYNILMRVNAKDRAEYFRTMFNVASISPNEIRAFENMNGYEGGDEHFMQMANATVENIIKVEK